MTKQKQFEQILKSAYNHKDFISFINEFLSGNSDPNCGIKFVAPEFYQEERSNFSYYVDGYYHIGNYTADNNQKILLLSVCLRKGETVERARSMQRNFVKKLIENSNCVGALVAFYTKDEPDKWRFSFIRLDYEFSKGKISEKLTPARRYSYLVGKGEPCATALQRLFPIYENDFEKFAPSIEAEKISVDQLEEAFSVEKVTNEFFDRYKEKYFELKEYLDSNEDFKIESSIKGFNSEQFAKKLIGQIVFLYFLQKKGWLGVNSYPDTLTEKEFKQAFYAKGNKSRELMPKVYRQTENGDYKRLPKILDSLPAEDKELIASIVKGGAWGSGPKDFMRKIYVNSIKRGENFFDDCLEPLFYTGLNTNRGENCFYAPLCCRIPFLNGGLFEELENYDWQNNNFNIPNEFFSNSDKKERDADGLLDIFDRYNFTMNEDEPLEREVAIDPEMLGKVFENLLDVKDRKSKGAFYTPREIVHYMCQETLINYLVTKSGISEEAIRNFILYGEYFRDEDTRKGEKEKFATSTEGELLISDEIFSLKKGVDRLKEIDDLLANVKVADLAVGSGAFPLGMLNEITKARNILTSYMSIGMNSFDKKNFILYGRRNYDLKINAIKNCIFACDIEPSAVDIAKLRLWLSIVIDDILTTEAQGDEYFNAHSKPNPLPNLDCNIICGNSLVDEFKGVKLISQSDLLNNTQNGHQFDMFQSGVDVLISKLIELQDKLFFCKYHEEKEEIKQQIQNIYNQIILEQIKSDPKLVDEYFETLEEPSKPFILWQLYFPKVFKENGGFDIVIGNPPYGAKLDQKVKDIYKKKYKEVQFKIDSYVLFIIKAMELCKNGDISFIIPNTLLNNYFLGNLRERLIQETNITHLINFNSSVFEATVHSLILQFHNKKSNKYNKTYMAWNLNENKIYLDQYEFSKNENFAFQFLDSNSGNSLFEKLNKKSIKLEEILDIRQAIKSGNDKKYITEEPIGNAKKILRGKDVFKYRYTDPKLFLDYGKHLACPRDEKIFNETHILIREAGKTITATIDYEHFYIMSSLYCGVMKTKEISIEYMLGLINSKLFQYLMYKLNFENTQGAFTKAKIYHYNQLPVILPNKEDENKITDLVKNMLKNGIDNNIESEIDSIIYKIYSINEEEVSLIEKIATI